MKRFIIASALSLFALVSCKSVNVEERREAFHSDIQAIVAEYNEVAPTAQSQEELREIYDATVLKIKELCITTVKKNADNELGVEAFREVFPDLTPEEAEELIALLKGENKTNEYILAAQKTLEAKENTEEGCMFVDFDINGVKLSDFVGQGKWVLVDFWASWCGPCKAEIPNIANVYEKYHGDNFNVLSVAVWDKVEDTKAAAEQLGIVWDQIVDAQKVPTELYGIEGIPHIILFGPDGTIVKRELRGEAIEAAVKEALGL